MALVTAGGCRSAVEPTGDMSSLQTTQPTTAPAAEVAPLASSRWVEELYTEVRPPVGWVAEEVKGTDGSKHQAWKSPTGATAYGVLNVRHFFMPLASNERILREFLNGMKESEGSAELLAKEPAPGLGGVGGLRFVAKGGRYTVRGNLASSGRNAWIWYAGTLNETPVNPGELQAAEMAREKTLIAPARGK